MKTQLTIISLLLITISSYSQEFKKMKVGIGIGFPSQIPPTLLYLEPAYRINDYFSLSSRIEGVFIPGNQRQFTAGSVAMMGQYYFPTTDVYTRFYVGAGIGWYSIDQSGGMCDCSIQTEKNNVGFIPRIGFDIKHFNLTFDYNYLPKIRETTLSTIPNATQQPYVSYFNASYFAIKVGVSIGGGKKKKN